MKIAIVGATGLVGTRVVSEALNRGYEVLALARKPETLTIIHENLQTQAVDAFDINALASALQGADAVVSTYNAGWANPDLYQDFIKGSEAIQQATKIAGLKRLLVVGGAGSLEIEPGKQLVDSPEFPADWKTGATAARDYLNILKQEQDLDWTFLSPAINLHPGERTGQFRLGTDSPVFDANGKCDISVEDLAVAIVDELEKNIYVKRRFTVGY
jgi:putative NADH-flavin reductase